MTTMTVRSDGQTGRNGASPASPRGAAPDAIARMSAVAEGFRSVSLADLGAAALMDRVDTKFVIPALSAPEILAGLGDEYRVLEVSGRRLSRYSTRYFDTPDLRLYHDHHAGRGRRFKVRVRTYVDSEARFLEVKLRTGKGRTTKERVSLAHELLDPVERLARDGMLGSQRAFSARELRESLVVDYTRLTLVRDASPERVTLDLMLRFSRGGETRSFPGVVIGEIKQARRVRSRFLEAMRELRLREGSLSKYCLGIAALEPAARTNNFRSALRRLETTDRGARALA
jgi:hypothetical protein